MIYTVAVTSQGQLSIPASLRRKFGFDKMGRAQVTEQEGKLVIEPIRDLLELKGSLKTKKPLIPASVIRQSFEEYVGGKLSQPK